MSEAVQPSSYPALHRVLLIESRFSTRAETLKALKAANLFETVVEPSSLEDGLNQLKRMEFDACIVGSSVSRERAENFVREAKTQSLSRDCAFFVLVREGEEAFVVSAHQAIVWPTSKSEFFRLMILGVVKANANSPWAAILERDGGVPVEYRESASQSHEQDQSPSVASLLSAESLVDLQEIASRISSKELTLGADGRPDEKARAALDAVINRVFSANLRSAKIAEFRAYFTDALDIWFADCVRYSVEVGTNNLRRSLLSWAKN
ncbi:MAG: hypothetical protein U0136_07325 [Bdellovibrionota bacterium]